ncbi:MAG: hypothetical protein MJ166_08485 [Clostridia bacterium]|nr:hypothetical protein [Clostridia bacterium]
MRKNTTIKTIAATCLLSMGLAGCLTGCEEYAYKPALSDDDKEAYLEAAADYFYDEYGLKVNSDDLKIQLYFSAGHVLYGSKAKAMEHRDEWLYSVFVKCKNGDSYIVDVSYDDLELLRIIESKVDKDFDEGDIIAINDEYEELTEKMANEFFEMVEERDLEFFEDRIADNCSKDFDEDDIEALFDECEGWEFYGATCSPVLEVEDGDELRYVYYVIYATDKKDCDKKIAILEVLDNDSDRKDEGIHWIQVIDSDAHQSHSTSNSGIYFE